MGSHHCGPYQPSAGNWILSRCLQDRKDGQVIEPRRRPMEERSLRLESSDMYITLSLLRPGVLLCCTTQSMLIDTLMANQV